MASLVGIVNVKFPAVIVCEPNVKVPTAFLPAAVSLYMVKASNAVAKVTVVQAIDALGVQKAVVPVEVGAVALVNAAPVAVYPVPETSLVAEYAVVPAPCEPVAKYRAPLKESFVVPARITVVPKACRPFKRSTLNEVDNA